MIFLRRRRSPKAGCCQRRAQTRLRRARFKSSSACFKTGQKSGVVEAASSLAARRPRREAVVTEWRDRFSLRFRRPTRWCGEGRASRGHRRYPGCGDSQRRRCQFRATFFPISGETSSREVAGRLGWQSCRHCDLHPEFVRGDPDLPTAVRAPLMSHPLIQS